MIYNATGAFKGKTFLTIYFNNAAKFKRRRIVIT
jgi:hypothetical protein